MARRTTKYQSRLQGIITREMEQCIGVDNEQLSTARLELKKAYYGDGYGVDGDRRTTGWSTYVDRSVMETVEWAKGPLLKVFAGTEDIVRYEPTSAADEQYAEDATEYVNRCVFGRRAFDMVYGPLSDGLYQRVGWAKVYYHAEDRRSVMQVLDGLDEAQAVAVVMAVQAAGDEADVEVIRDKSTGLYAATVYHVEHLESIEAEPLPSERVIFSRDATTIESARFVAHWEDRMVGELISEGYDAATLREIASNFDDYPETQRSQQINSTDTGTVDNINNSDGTRQIRVYEAYLWADIEGKGTIGRYKVVYAGSPSAITVLDSEPWDMYRPPIFAFSSLPIPYSPVGLSLADLVMDIQVLRSEITRHMLDNGYLSNHGELHVNRGAGGEINLDELGARGPGRYYESKGPVTITALPFTSMAEEMIAALQLTEKAREQRTGVGLTQQGLSADVLQQTATGASIQEEQQNVRIEMIARIYAEVYAQMARYILVLAQRYLKQPIIMQRQGNFVELQPSQWNPAMNVVASVGLGTGNRRKKAESVQQIIALQSQFIAAFGKNSPVRLENVVRSAHKLADTLGFESPEQYFGSVEDAQRYEQQLMQEQGGGGVESNPTLQAKMAEIQMRGQIEREKLQLAREKAAADVQNDAAKIQAAMDLRAAEAQQNALLKATEAQQKAALAREQMQLEAELDSIKLATTLPDVGASVVKNAMTL